jgi:hypothetical protein
MGCSGSKDAMGAGMKSASRLNPFEAKGDINGR